MIFQTHKDKFKGLICLSSWHKQINEKELLLPNNLVIKSSNAIFQERFNKNVNKIKNKFIWTSSVNRGLDYALEMMEEIYQKYQDAKLYIYVNISHLSDSQLEYIKNKPYIILNHRISQEKLSEELLSSDVWLYPNNFQETYCISAVEAQMAKCLVCTNVHAGLEDTVNNRGAVIFGKYNKEKLLKKLFEVMEDTELKKDLIERGYNYAKSQSYHNLINQFEFLFNNEI
jgi:glycosyltransferase involved in cell wall biosynthesis